MILTVCAPPRSTSPTRRPQGMSRGALICCMLTNTETYSHQVMATVALEPEYVSSAQAASRERRIQTLGITQCLKVVACIKGMYKKTHTPEPCIVVHVGATYGYMHGLLMTPRHTLTFPFCCPHRLKQQTTLCALAREVIVSCRHNSRRSRHSDPRMDFVTKPLESTSVEALPALPHACSCCRGAVSPPGHLSSKCQLDTAGARLATAAEYESYMKVRGTCLLLSTHPQPQLNAWRPTEKSGSEASAASHNQGSVACLPSRGLRHTATAANT